MTSPKSRFADHVSKRSFIYLHEPRNGEQQSQRDQRAVPRRRAARSDSVKLVGRALERYLCHECTSTDNALGLRQPRGGVPWWLRGHVPARRRTARSRRHGGGRSIALDPDARGAAADDPLRRLGVTLRPGPRSDAGALSRHLPRAHLEGAQVGRADAARRTPVA